MWYNASRILWNSLPVEARALPSHGVVEELVEYAMRRAHLGLLLAYGLQATLRDEAARCSFYSVRRTTRRAGGHRLV